MSFREPESHDADAADDGAPALDSPDPDRVYGNYLDTCRRLGLEPVPWDRVLANRPGAICGTSFAATIRAWGSVRDSLARARLTVRARL